MRCEKIALCIAAFCVAALWCTKLSHCSSRETPFREWDFSFRELFFELRELLREYPGTLPELREWPFRSESFFPKIGVVPRLLIYGGTTNKGLGLVASVLFQIDLSNLTEKLRTREMRKKAKFDPTKAPTRVPTRVLSGPLNRLNAILSLLHPLDRYRTPSAIGNAIGRPLSRPISHPRAGRSSQPPRSKPLRGLNRAIVVL